MLKGTTAAYSGDASDIRSVHEIATGASGSYKTAYLKEIPLYKSVRVRWNNEKAVTNAYSYFIFELSSPVGGYLQVSDLADPGYTVSRSGNTVTVKTPAGHSDWEFILVANSTVIKKQYSSSGVNQGKPTINGVY